MFLVGLEVVSRLFVEVVSDFWACPRAPVRNMNHECRCMYCSCTVPRRTVAYSVRTAVRRELMTLGGHCHSLVTHCLVGEWDEMSCRQLTMPAGDRTWQATNDTLLLLLYSRTIQYRVGYNINVVQPINHVSRCGRSRNLALHLGYTELGHRLRFRDDL